MMWSKKFSITKGKQSIMVYLYHAGRKTLPLLIRYSSWQQMLFVNYWHIQRVLWLDRMLNRYIIYFVVSHHGTYGGSLMEYRYLLCVYSYTEVQTPFFLCFLLCQEVCFLLFSFFLVSNYPLFSDTVKLLRGTNVSFANSHFTFTLKKYQPDGFKKMPIMSNILFEIKVPLQNASHVINCLKLYVALWMHEKLRIPSLY